MSSFERLVGFTIMLSDHCLRGIFIKASLLFFAIVSKYLKRKKIAFKHFFLHTKNY